MTKTDLKELGESVKHAQDIAADAFAFPPSDTISTNDLALIGIDAKLNRLECLAERSALAAERQADALETLTALLASLIGVSTARCSDDGRTINYHAVNYLRASSDGGRFQCDHLDDTADGDE